MLNLLQLPWWSRVSVLQEYVLSGNRVCFRCDSDVISKEILLLVHQRLQSELNVYYQDLLNLYSKDAITSLALTADRLNTMNLFQDCHNHLKDPTLSDMAD
jgi:hypothetical protein